MISVGVWRSNVPIRLCLRDLAADVLQGGFRVADDDGRYGLENSTGGLTMEDRSSETLSIPGTEVAEEMKRYGITRVPVDYFHYKNYRYTNVSDAIAQAKRDQDADESV